MVRVTRAGRTWEVQPGRRGWTLAEIRTRESGEYRSGVTYHPDLAAALGSLADRMAAEEVAPDASLAEAVATIAHIYRTIREAS